jgi:hypothetical protein
VPVVNRKKEIHMSATGFIIVILAITVIACNVFHVTFTTPDIIGMVVVVPCLTAALYRAFTVFGISE